MFFKKIKSDILAHNSSSGGWEMAVIDPGVTVWSRRLQRLGAQTSQDLETHKNEDYVSGSGFCPPTRAEIFHGAQEDLGSAPM